jgi:uncharacterized protein YutE (UPF0331/DUF86 family)
LKLLSELPHYFDFQIFNSLPTFIRKEVLNRYGEIDDEIAYEEIKNGLKDFEEFEKGIENFLKKVKAK